jgi:hypothetical protein
VLLALVFMGLGVSDALARTLSVNSTAHMALVGGSGNTLVEEGHSYGRLSGRIRANLALNGTTVRLVFTIYLHAGSVTGRGTGKLNVGHGTYASFAGALQISHGTGRYRHARGAGNIYGTINRNDDSAVVQAIGTMRY